VMRRETLKIAILALEPLVQIANAYERNELDDEARRFWGPNLENQNKTPASQIELYCGRGGKCLLTLEQCMEGRRVYRELLQEMKSLQT